MLRKPVLADLPAIQQMVTGAISVMEAQGFHKVGSYVEEEDLSFLEDAYELGDKKEADSDTRKLLLLSKAMPLMHTPLPYARCYSDKKEMITLSSQVS